MIVYLDTSAWAKLYMNEPGRENVLNAVHESDNAAICVIGYTELHSAFGRRLRQREITQEEFQIAIDAMERDWPRFIKIQATEELCKAAAGLTQHGLRSLDALHLAAALEIQIQVGNVVFLSFDIQLMRVAGRFIPLREGIS